MEGGGDRCRRCGEGVAYRAINPRSHINICLSCHAAETRARYKADPTPRKWRVSGPITTKTEWLDRMGVWYVPEPNTGCWLWLRSTRARGYGQVFHDGKMRLAYRVAYELFRGPIPEGLVIDHLCRTPSCVNPDHLEVVTQRVNMIRSPSAWPGVNHRKTHCIHGHEFTSENIYPKADGGRECWTCKRTRRAEWSRRRAQKRMEALPTEA